MKIAIFSEEVFAGYGNFLSRDEKNKKNSNVLRKITDKIIRCENVESGEVKMAGLIDELMNTLEKENDEYQELLKVAQEKTGTIIRADIEALQKLTEQEQLIVDRIAPLEKKRVEYTKDIATVINRPVESLTITRLTELMENQPAVKQRLSELHDKLRDTMKQMVKVNDMNQGLLKEALDLVNFDITLVNSMKQAPITANYDKSASNVEQHMISRGGFDKKQ